MGYEQTLKEIDVHALERRRETGNVIQATRIGGGPTEMRGHRGGPYSRYGERYTNRNEKAVVRELELACSKHSPLVWQ